MCTCKFAVQAKKKDKEGSDNSESVQKRERPKKEEEPTFQFGWLNVVIIFGCGRSAEGCFSCNK